MLCQLVLPWRWDGGVLSYSLRGWLKCLSVVQLKDQTDLYDQMASATVHWLLENRLNSRNSGEKPSTEQKKITLYSSTLSLNILRGFKQAICDNN